MKLKIGDMVKGVQAGVIVQQVNAQGVMGSGLAKSIRDAYPEVFTQYSEFIGPAYTQKDSGRGFLGELIMVQVDPHLWIANIVGQQFFGRTEGMRYTSYDALDVGFKKLATWSFENGIESEQIHHAAIGCGLGGAEWSIVAPIIEHYLGKDTTLWVLQ